MKTIRERVEFHASLNSLDEAIVFAAVEREELLVWNGRGHLARLSFHKPPLNVLRKSERGGFRINWLLNTIVYEQSSIMLPSPFLKK